LPGEDKQFVFAGLHDQQQLPALFLCHAGLLRTKEAKTNANAHTHSVQKETALSTDVWNREELYAEVWETTVVTLPSLHVVSEN